MKYPVEGSIEPEIWVLVVDENIPADERESDEPRIMCVSADKKELTKILQELVWDMWPMSWGKQPATIEHVRQEHIDSFFGDDDDFPEYFYYIRKAYWIK